MNASSLRLGGQVMVAAELRREHRRGAGGWTKVWIRHAVRPSCPAIVVGVRTLSNGKVDYSAAEVDGVQYNPTEFLQGVLVAYDLRRRPAFALAEDLTPVGEPMGALPLFDLGVLGPAVADSRIPKAVEVA